MSRPTTVSTQEIITAARTLFLERGADVPTLEIAKMAGVSEGSVFKRFPTKQSLFVAAMGLDDELPWEKELKNLPGEDFRRDLAELALKIIDFLKELLPRVMLLWSSKELGALPHAIHGKNSPPHRAVAVLAEYFDQQMRAGRMRVGHPEIVARVFMGALHNYAFFETMGIEVRGHLDAATYVHSLVETLWQGLAPQTERRR